MRRQRRAARRRKNSRRDVIPARVHRPAPARARRAGKAPADRGIRMPRGLKRLRGAKLHARGTRRQAQREVTRNRHCARAGFRGIGMARCGDLDRCGGRQVDWRVVNASSCDRSQRGVSSRHTAHAPTHSGIRCIRHHSRKRHLVAEHNCPARWRYTHDDGWRRGRRRRGSTSCAAATRPRALRQNGEQDNRGRPEFFSVPTREGAHAIPKAGEGPAKRKGNRD